VSRRNERYLASAQFPDSLQVEPDLATALAAARDVLIVVPSPAFRALLTQLASHLAPDMHVAWATKGFEHASLKLPHQIAREVLGAERRVAVRSEEHTSELQSRGHLVCRLLLEKKKKKTQPKNHRK